MATTRRNTRKATEPVVELDLTEAGTDEPTVEDTAADEAKIAKAAAKAEAQRLADIDKMAGLVAFVRAHAVKHYDDNAGWDVVVEAWDDEHIASIIGNPNRTPIGAARKVAVAVSEFESARKEVVNA